MLVDTFRVLFFFTILHKCVERTSLQKWKIEHQMIQSIHSGSLVNPEPGERRFMGTSFKKRHICKIGTRLSYR